MDGKYRGLILQKVFQHKNVNRPGIIYLVRTQNFPKNWQYLLSDMHT